MKRLFVAAALIASASFAQSNPAPVRPLDALPYTPSLDVPSMDRSADPCGDFYQFTCGGWIANNPIPPDQAAWSVYGKLEEDNVQYLWGVLEDAAKPRADRTAVQQKIGDYFAACMNTPAIETLGAKPLQPLLDEIHAIRSRKDLAAFLAKEHQRNYSSGWLFGFGADQDFGDATQVIAFAHAGGLSLPDRDYYTKSEKRSKEIRQKYLQHVTRMLQLIGESKEQAAKDAKTVMRIETGLGKASLTRVEQRDPYNLYHKMTRAELTKLTPSFDWNRYLADNGIPNVSTINVTEPKFFKAVETEIKDVPLADWKTYLRWHAVHARAPYLSNDVGLWYSTARLAHSSNTDGRLSFDDATGYGVSFNHFWTGPLSTEFSAYRLRAQGGIDVAGSRVLDVGKLELKPITANVQWHFARASMLSPYVGGGLAYVSAGDLSSSDLDLAGIGTVKIDKKLTWDANAGINIGLGRMFAIGVDAKYIKYEPDSKAAGSTEKLKFNPMVLSAGVKLRW